MMMMMTAMMVRVAFPLAATQQLLTFDPPQISLRESK